MKKVISSERLPIKLWLDDIESQAMDQAKNLANLPFAFKHIAIMPDSHCGYGMPIGGVMATKGVVIPNCVGVDIGCGMCVVKTSLTELDQDNIKKIFSIIRSYIPVGVGKKHRENQSDKHMPDYPDEGKMPVVALEYQNALKSIGTLGAGNHFIEIQKGNDGHIYLMLHSGSRNLGLKVAKHHNEIAKKLNKRWYTSVPQAYDLAFLPLDSDEARTYLREMNYCVEFALANRSLMMQRMVGCVESVNPGTNYWQPINIAHNYATMENHFGDNVMVHRKGATLARSGQLGIIPGCQGSASYIVKGRGNPESFMSCSHGAGRAMSRSKAKKELDLATEIKKLDDLGIVHSIRDVSNLDEAEGAYKDISVVMDNQSDLVEIEVELKPLGVIKG